MEHDDVVTLFHEFGHLMHHVLGGQQRWARFSGVATEWDFVEAPGQMFEEWAWDADVLRDLRDRRRRRADPGRPGRQDARGRRVRQGLPARAQQMFYAALSYRLHRERPDGPHRARCASCRSSTTLFAPCPTAPLPRTAFGHLVGYSAYYTYMWSLVIAKDLFSRVRPRRPASTPTSPRRYRDRVLAPGGSQDAADLVADFLGRPYDAAAFRAWLERSPEQ